jgi:hypothetical protein
MARDDRWEPVIRQELLDRALEPEHMLRAMQRDALAPSSGLSTTAAFAHVAEHIAARRRARRAAQR